MSLSVYVHIPYCIQRCRYCDFTTFEQSTIMPPGEYLNLLLKEMKNRSHTIEEKHLRSIYFGGGTPSLVPAEDIVSIIAELANLGFELDESTEVTIEINPATISEKSLKTYTSAGVNRFSVGAQTFDDSLLKLCGREHNSQQTRQTLDLLSGNDLNYSFDLLFALPGQSLDQLEKDLKIISDYSPNHLSAYCLTVPQGHPMDRGRPPEEDQLTMFDKIESHLGEIGLEKYEISNFARPGFESAHNLSYWTNLPYWGLGLSAHSYFPAPDYGVRFWNPKSFPEYISQVELSADQRPYDGLPDDQRESLKLHESLTDICHMFLRMRAGLPEAVLQNLFSSTILSRVWPRLDKLVTRNLLLRTEKGWQLSPEGELISNAVFAELTFDSEEIR